MRRRQTESKMMKRSSSCAELDPNDQAEVRAQNRREYLGLVGEVCQRRRNDPLLVDLTQNLQILWKKGRKINGNESEKRRRKKTTNQSSLFFALMLIHQEYVGGVKVGGSRVTAKEDKDSETIFI